MPRRISKGTPAETTVKRGFALTILVCTNPIIASGCYPPSLEDDTEGGLLPRRISKGTPAETTVKRGFALTILVCTNPIIASGCYPPSLEDDTEGCFFRRQVAPAVVSPPAGGNINKSLIFFKKRKKMK